MLKNVKKLFLHILSRVPLLHNLKMKKPEILALNPPFLALTWNFIIIGTSVKTKITFVFWNKVEQVSKVYCTITGCYISDFNVAGPKCSI